ncbi:hypothetical protein VKT23_016016 [Stygiomarasmius scandens]|uniref:Uncharacterized protein n=1 Tax=Marasmiellus scandens TaxID=2682957 RepID=A0ABR1IW49_9AGAR
MSLQLSNDSDPTRSLESLTTIVELSPGLVSESDSGSSSSTTSYEAAGPGTLTGKVIYKLGQQMLKGIEHATVAGKLVAFAARSPYRSSFEMCSDILELCR